MTLNEIGRVQLRTRRPVLFDPYRRNRTTGSFVLVDDATGQQLAFVVEGLFAAGALALALVAPSGRILLAVGVVAGPLALALAGGRWSRARRATARRAHGRT